jgi:SRSO17 transposase
LLGRSAALALVFVVSCRDDPSGDREHDYRELKTGLGIDHFEGRSYLGWHRHVTLAALAQAFCTMIRTDPKAPAPG